MTLWWILDFVLLLVVVPIVVVLLKNVLDEANGIVPAVERIKAAAQSGSKDLDAVPLLLTTQDQVRQTVENVAAYGGSLDVILDDAS
jgi:NAD(P)-dependent dehydrogenase (short-subunit alcohol dehydrogenase family)